jgi:lysozyme family protein
MTEQERFDRCLGAVLRFEGGYADNPRDPGGPTKLGVTIAVLSQALGRPATEEEVRALTPAAVTPIYHERYWRPAGCEQWAPGLDLLLFDTAVNMGPGTAVQMLQRALAVGADGVAGPRTLTAAAEANLPCLIEAICRERGERYRGLARFDVFGAGWLNRLRTVQTLALDWARKAAEPPDPATTGEPT